MCTDVISLLIFQYHLIYHDGAGQVQYSCLCRAGIVFRPVWQLVIKAKLVYILWAFAWFDQWDSIFHLSGTISDRNEIAFL